MLRLVVRTAEPLIEAPVDRLPSIGRPLPAVTPESTVFEKNTLLPPERPRTSKGPEAEAGGWMINVGADRRGSVWAEFGFGATHWEAVSKKKRNCELPTRIGRKKT